MSFPEVSQVLCVCFRFAAKFNLVDKAIAAALYLLITADGVESMGVMCYLTNRCMLGRIFHAEVNTQRSIIGAGLYQNVEQATIELFGKSSFTAAD